MTIEFLTDKGLLREGNEDRPGKSDELRLGIVADGLGGHAAGEVASATAVDTLLARFAETAVEVDGLALLEVLRDGVQAAHEAILAQAAAQPERTGMGAALTVALVRGGHYHLAHVGDTRAYLLRDGRLLLLTRDDSVVEGYVLKGALTPEQAAASPHRNVLSQALGNATITVGVYRGRWEPGDGLLLCSDGLFGVVPHAYLESLLRRSEEPAAILQAMIDAANEAGGPDNITALLMLDDQYAPPAPPVAEESTQELAAAAEESRPSVEATNEEATNVDAAAPVAAVAPPHRRGCFTGCVVLLAALLGIFVSFAAWHTMGYRWHLDGQQFTLHREIDLFRQAEVGAPETLRTPLTLALNDPVARKPLANLQYLPRRHTREEAIADFTNALKTAVEATGGTNAALYLELSEVNGALGGPPLPAPKPTADPGLGSLGADAEPPVTKAPRGKKAPQPPVSSNE
jgi:protein phosphatase